MTGLHVYSEASEKYIKAVNRLNIVTFLISFLSAADQCPTRVVVAAGNINITDILERLYVNSNKLGQCLTTLTDDNKDIYIEFQRHPEYVQMLLNILTKFETPDKLLIRVLACGNVFYISKGIQDTYLPFLNIAILMNVREVVQLSGSWDDERDALGELNKIIMPILIISLDYDIQNAANEVKQIIESGVSVDYGIREISDREHFFADIIRIDRMSLSTMNPLKLHPSLSNH